MRANPSQEEIRRHNLGALLRSVHRHGALSRAELTTRLGLNRSTIGALTTDLATAGLVTEQAPRETGRAGRPSPLVTPRSQAVCAYALSIEVDRVRVARVGLGGAVLDRREDARPPGYSFAAAAGTLDRLLAEMHAAARAAAPHELRAVGCGIALSGYARDAAGTITLSEPDEHATEHLRAGLAARLGAPPLLAGAADLGALAEHTRGVAAGSGSVLYLHGDGGITAGIISGGRLLSGQWGVAGEVGHMVVHPEGGRCACGADGCWDTEVGEHALLRAAGRSAVGGRPAVREVLEATARGDATAAAGLRQVAGWLGLGVGNLVNVLNPEVVIFGGMLRDVFLAAAAPLRSRLNAVGLAGRRAQVRLRTPALGEDAILVGAAELVFERLLADPLAAAG